MRVLIYIVLVACISSGCISTRASFETEATVAHIIASKRLDGGPTYAFGEPFFLPINGVLIPIAPTYIQSESVSYFYALETSNKQVITTQSLNYYEVGSCVVLWHPPIEFASDVKRNFVAGTLMNSNEC